MYLLVGASFEMCLFFLSLRHMFIYLTSIKHLLRAMNDVKSHAHRKTIIVSTFISAKGLRENYSLPMSMSMVCVCVFACV